jgi:hypothetical protein
MADKERPVWVWLPEAVTPVQCGTFAWSPGLGKFAYSDAYKAHGNALPIDPINLPFSRAVKPETTTLMNGVFGVLRDAAPEGFGLDLLLAIHEKEMLDEVERAQTVHSTWRFLYAEACGMAEENLEAQRPAFELAEHIVTGRQTVDLSKFERRPRRSTVRATTPPARKS